MERTILGIEKLLTLKPQGRLGLVCNQASLLPDLQHIADVLYENKKFDLKVLFGPQHGIRGEKQDNMIESGHFVDERTGLKVFSLYSETRELTSEMAACFDTLIFDLQDVGARYYTFLSTLVNCLHGCKKYSKKLIVADRPNPVGGLKVEGNLIKPGYSSFVGAVNVAIRHGMTLGELALYSNDFFNINADLEILQLENWSRSFYWEATKLPWIMPSPNMPSNEAAVVYPGGCLFEATNISEGRGTTKPFEYIGAPYIDPYKLIDFLQDLNIQGVILRPVYFQPTFNKWKGEVCGGLHLYVTDRNLYDSYLTALKIIYGVNKLWPRVFNWKEPPYEYEFEKLPIDILTGEPRIREIIEQQGPLSEIEKLLKAGVSEFSLKRKEYLLYL